MQYIKLQLGCLVVILYIIVNYVKATIKKDIPCNRLYDTLMVIAPWAVFFDGLTAWTVNHMEISTTSMITIVGVTLLIQIIFPEVLLTSICPTILQKSGKLTDEEYAIMKEHAARGGEIIHTTFKNMGTPELVKIFLDSREEVEALMEKHM